MKDERKTKKQLIEELEKLRGQADQDPFEARLAEAVERVREYAVSMRHSSDLMTLVGVMFEEVQGLGIDVACPTIVFLNPESDHCAYYNSFPNPAQYGISWTSPNLVAYSDEIATQVGGGRSYNEWIQGEDGQKWQQGASWVDRGTIPEDYAREGAEALGLSRPVLEWTEREWIRASVPFDQGLLKLATWEDHPQLTAVAEALTDALSLGYVRFLDLQRLEEQNRNLEVEQALERVRTQVAAMQESHDLFELHAAMGAEMRRLGVECSGIGINLFDQEAGVVRRFTGWAARRGSPDEGASEEADWEFWRSGQTWVRHCSSEEIEKWYAEAVRRGSISEEEAKSLPQEGRWVVDVPFAQGTLATNRPGSEPFSDDDIAILERLTEVFALGYTRYLDLQAAEERAAEAVREAAYERVRARALAMQKSEDLAEVAAAVFDELAGLVPAQLWRCWIALVDDESKSAEIWLTSAETGKAVMADTRFVLAGHPVNESMYRGWERGEDYFSMDLQGEVLRDVIRFNLEAGMDLPEWRTRPAEDLPERLIIYDVYFPSGFIHVAFQEPLTERDLNTLRGFRDVFSLAYTRFEDLQAAEERAARSAREAAYERVRSAVLASRGTEDIIAAADLMGEELRALGVPASASGINIVDEEAGEWRQFAGTAATARLEDPNWPEIAKVVEHWRDARTYMRPPKWSEWDVEGAREWAGEEGVSFLHSVKVVVDVAFTYGTLAMSSAEVDEFSEEDIAILQGFAEVIDLAYTRYLDFEKLEAQNRQLEIEQILERVRGRALAMHRSEDLMDVAATVFGELRNLNVAIRRCGFAICNDAVDPPEMEMWLTTTEGDAVRTGKYAMDAGAASYMEGIYTAWKHGEEHHCYDLHGDQLRAAVLHLVEERGLSFPDLEGSSQEALPERMWFNYLFFRHGCLVVHTLEPLAGAEILHVLKQFAAIFGIAYSRFLELQQAEEYARQAQRRAAVDRVRAEIATMRSSADLEHLTPLIWQELTDAGVSFFRCGVFIATDDGRRVQSYLTNPEGESLAVLDLAAESHPLLEQVMASWQAKRLLTEQWDRETFLGWMDRLQEQGQDVERGRYLDAEEPPESLNLHFIPFAQGMLYVGSAAPLPEDDLSLVQEIATAFSVAYARYRDFERLEEANRRLQEATEQKSQFLSRMSHDLRTPMNAIIGYTRILLRRAKDALEDRQYRNLENIQTSADNLLRLINEILDLSRIEAGRIELRPEPVDVGQLVGECVTSVAPLARPGVELVQELGDVPKVTTDGDRTRRVVMNLLGNAVKFTEAGSITVSLNSVDSGVELAVADTGVGIPAEDLPHIFEEFRQVERQVGDKTEGTGLGLAIAARSVEMLGGTISAESEVGVGTTFTLRIGDYQTSSGRLTRPG